jgi:hypothetical protein
MVSNSTRQPIQPTHLSSYAEICLQAIANQGLGGRLSLLVASKMVALVERGAPRDFRDIYALCRADLTTPHDCWALWERRQELSGSDVDRARARLAVETHLTRIALHRPLERIADPQQQAEAEQLRAWFRGVFLDVPS